MVGLTCREIGQSGRLSEASPEPRPSVGAPAASAGSRARDRSEKRRPGVMRLPANQIRSLPLVQRLDRQVLLPRIAQRDRQRLGAQRLVADTTHPPGDVDVLEPVAGDPGLVQRPGQVGAKRLATWLDASVGLKDQAGRS